MRQNDRGQPPRWAIDGQCQIAGHHRTVGRAIGDRLHRRQLHVVERRAIGHQRLELATLAVEQIIAPGIGVAARPHQDDILVFARIDKTDQRRLGECLGQRSRKLFQFGVDIMYARNIGRVSHADDPPAPPYSRKAADIDFGMGKNQFLASRSIERHAERRHPPLMATQAIGDVRSRIDTIRIEAVAIQFDRAHRVPAFVTGLAIEIVRAARQIPGMIVRFRTTNNADDAIAVGNVFACSGIDLLNHLPTHRNRIHQFD
ncbi:hypothetical protein [Sphingomonas sp.]